MILLYDMTQQLKMNFLCDFGPKYNLRQRSGLFFILSLIVLSEYGKHFHVPIIPVGQRAQIL